MITFLWTVHFSMESAKPYGNWLLHCYIEYIVVSDIVISGLNRTYSLRNLKGLSLQTLSRVRTSDKTTAEKVCRHVRYAVQKFDSRSQPILHVVIFSIEAKPRLPILHYRLITWLRYPSLAGGSESRDSALVYNWQLKLVGLASINDMPVLSIADAWLWRICHEV